MLRGSQAEGSRFARRAALGRLVVSLVLLVAALGADSVGADDGDPALEVRQTTVIWEWSPYYSSVGALIPLTDAPPNVADASVGEFEVYRRLAATALQPNVLLLEASIYPMPLLGTEIRKRYPEPYARDDARFRLIPALTAGFQEPWAASVFLGNDMIFVRPGQAVKETNRGYMGFLASVGNRHIKDNLLIDDNWLELEWKLKGERKFAEDRLSWSFRLGTRFHRNPDIENTVYVGLRRSSLDFNAPFMSWMQNSRVSLLSEFLRSSGQFSRQEVIFGKKLPFRSLKSAMQLEFGFIYERQIKYSGDLVNTGGTGFTFVIRPNIEF